MFLLTASLLGFNKLKPTVLSAFSPSRTFSEISGYCSHVPPIPADEFLERQQRLINTLASLNASAYITEPGPSAYYYANLSSWELSERPLLLIISSDASSRPNVTILTPAFEESRARLMNIPSRGPVSYAAWREEANPYKVAIEAIPSLAARGPVFVDGEMRTFVLDGLSRAAPLTSVLPSPIEIQRLRQRKSTRELEIMKCANEVGNNRKFYIQLCFEHMFEGNPPGCSSCPTKDVYWYHSVQDECSPPARPRDRRPIKWRWSRTFRRLVSNA